VELVVAAHRANAVTGCPPVGGAEGSPACACLSFCVHSQHRHGRRPRFSNALLQFCQQQSLARPRLPGPAMHLIPAPPAGRITQLSSRSKCPHGAAGWVRQFGLRWHVLLK